MGLLKINEVFVMRGVGTVLMSSVVQGTLRRGVALNLPGDQSANVKMIEKNSQNLEQTEAGTDVAVVVTAPAELFEKGQTVEFAESGVESSFRT